MTTCAIGTLLEDGLVGRTFLMQSVGSCRQTSPRIPHPSERCGRWPIDSATGIEHMSAAFPGHQISFLRRAEKSSGCTGASGMVIRDARLGRSRGRGPTIGYRSSHGTGFATQNTQRLCKRWAGVRSSSGSASYATRRRSKQSSATFLGHLGCRSGSLVEIRCRTQEGAPAILSQTARGETA